MPVASARKLADEIISTSPLEFAGRSPHIPYSHIGMNITPPPQQSCAPLISVSPTVGNFFDVECGRLYAIPFTVKNMSNRVCRVSCMPPLSKCFHLLPFSKSIVPGMQCTILLEFNTFLQPCEVHDELVIHCDGESFTPDGTLLGGGGKGADIGVHAIVVPLHAWIPAPHIQLSCHHVDFGGVSLNHPVNSRKIKLTNTGKKDGVFQFICQDEASEMDDALVSSKVIIPGAGSSVSSLKPNNDNNQQQQINAQRGISNTNFSNTQGAAGTRGGGSGQHNSVSLTPMSGVVPAGKEVEVAVHLYLREAGIIGSTFAFTVKGQQKGGMAAGEGKQADFIMSTTSDEGWEGIGGGHLFPIEFLVVSANVSEACVKILRPAETITTGGAVVNNEIKQINFGKLYYGQKREVSLILHNMGHSPVSFGVSLTGDERLGESDLGYVGARGGGGSGKNGGGSEQDDSAAVPFPIEVTPREGRIPGNSNGVFKLTFKFGPQMATQRQGWAHAFVDETSLTRKWDLPVEIEILETEQKLEVQLLGEAVPVIVRSSEKVCKFGDCPVNDYRDYMLTLENLNGSLPVLFEFPRIPHFTAEPSRGVINARGRADIRLRFQPKQLGTFEEQFDVSLSHGIKKLPIIVDGRASRVVKKEKRPGGTAAIGEDFVKPLKLVNEMADDGGVAATKKAKTEGDPPRCSEAHEGPDGKCTTCPACAELARLYAGESEHNQLYNQYLKNCRLIRETKAEALHKLAADPVDIGMTPGEDLEEPEPEIQRDKVDRFPFHTGSLAKGTICGEGSVGDRCSLMTNIMKIIESGRVPQKWFRKEPSSLSEVRECKMVLSPKDLQKVLIPVKFIDFQTVCIFSVNKKLFFVHNELKAHIHVGISYTRDELIQSEPSGQVIPPGQTAAFNVVFRSEVSQTFQQAVYFTINYAHRLRFVVFAEVTPVELIPSTNEINFRFPDYGNDLSLAQTVTLRNPGNSEARFSWALTPEGNISTSSSSSTIEQAFFISPQFGSVPSHGGQTPVVVTYNPPLGVNESITQVELQVVGGGPEPCRLSLAGNVPSASCNWSVKEGKIDFKRMAVGAVRSQTIMLRNTSSGNAAAVYAFDTSQFFSELQLSQTRGRISPNSSEEVIVTLKSSVPGTLKCPLTCRVRGMKQLLKAVVTAESKVPELRFLEPPEDGCPPSQSVLFSPTLVANTEGGGVEGSIADAKDTATVTDYPSNDKHTSSHSRAASRHSKSGNAGPAASDGSSSSAAFPLFFDFGDVYVGSREYKRVIIQNRDDIYASLIFNLNNHPEFTLVDGVKRDITSRIANEDTDLFLVAGGGLGVGGSGAPAAGSTLGYPTLDGVSAAAAASGVSAVSSLQPGGLVGSTSVTVSPMLAPVSMKTPGLGGHQLKQNTGVIQIVNETPGNSSRMEHNITTNSVLDHSTAEEAEGMDNININTSRGLCYCVSIAPKECFIFYIVFTPTVIRDGETFNIPVTLAGTNNMRVLRTITITANGKRPKLVISPQNVDFGARVVICEGTSKIPNRIVITLTNETEGMLGWELCEKQGLQDQLDRLNKNSLTTDASGLILSPSFAGGHTKAGDGGVKNVLGGKGGAIPPPPSQAAFQLEPSSGKLNPGQTAHIRVTFIPTEIKVYYSKYSIYLDSDTDNAYSEINLKGYGTHPEIFFDRKELVLPPVPLDTPAFGTFYIGNNGYDIFELKYKIAGEGKLPITLKFPDGDIISSTTNTLLPVQVYFQSSQPMTFTVNIDFYDKSDNSIFAIPVTCTTDNSLLTTAGFLAYVSFTSVLAGGSTVSDFNMFSNPEANALRELLCADNGDKKPVMFKGSSFTFPKCCNAVTRLDDRYEATRASFQVCDSILQQTLTRRELNRVLQWLNSNVLPDPVEDLIGSLQLNQGKMLVDIIQMLFGKMPQFPKINVLGSIYVPAGGATASSGTGGATGAYGSLLKAGGTTARTLTLHTSNAAAGASSGGVVGKSVPPLSPSGSTIPFSSMLKGIPQPWASLLATLERLSSILLFLKQYGCCISEVRVEYFLKYEEYLRLLGFLMSAISGSTGGTDKTGVDGNKTGAGLIGAMTAASSPAVAMTMSLLGWRSLLEWGGVMGGGGGRASSPFRAGGGINRDHPMGGSPRGGMSANLGLSEKTFQLRSLHAWMLVLVQTIRVFFISRITWKTLRAFPPTAATTAFAAAEKWGAGTDGSCMGSNIYSQGESVLLKWLSVHFSYYFPRRKLEQALTDDQPQHQQRGRGGDYDNFQTNTFNENGINNIFDVDQDKRRIIDFVANLRDCCAFAAVVIAYIPGAFRRLNPERTDGTGIISKVEIKDHCDHNAVILLETMRSYGLDPRLTPRELVEGSALDNVLFSAYLFNSLPQYVPKITIKFKGKLLSQITKHVELTNPTPWPINYTVILEGSDDFKFSSTKITLEPSATTTTSISIIPHFAKKTSSLCMFVANKTSATIAFRLETDVQTEYAMETYTGLKSPLYETLVYEVMVENPFNTNAQFTVNIKQEYVKKSAQSDAENEAAKANMRGKRGGARAKSPAASAVKSYAEEESLKQFPEPFWSPTEVLIIRKKAKAKFVLHFLPCARGNYKAQVVFRDDRIGEFALNFLASASPPKAMQTVQMATTAAMAIEQNIQLSMRNQMVEKILVLRLERLKGIKGLSQKMNTQREAIEQEVANKEILYRVEFFNDKFQGPNPFFSCPKTFFLTSRSTEELKAAGVNWGGERLSGSAGNTSAHGLSIPVNFHPQNPGIYNAIMLLSSTWDVRCIFIKARSRPAPVRSELDFHCPARQQIVQDLPIINASEIDWSIKAELRGDYFTAPREIRVPAGKTKAFPLSFNPLWICDHTGSLELTNMDTEEKYIYSLRAKADEPLAEATLSVQCKAREVCKVVVAVPNISQGDVLYDVITDLSFLTGDPALSVSTGDTARYPFSVSPQFNGKVTGSLTFITPNKQYTWFVVEVTASRPPPEGTVEVDTEVRSGAVAEITVSNPSDRVVDFLVRREGEALFGDNILTIEAHSSTIYHLAYIPYLSGEREGIISFNNDDVGEFWYNLKLKSRPSPKVELNFECELGKTVRKKIDIFNTLGFDCNLTLINSNEMNFTVMKPSNGALLMKAGTNLTLNITYTPSTINEKQEGIITLSHPQIDSWVYHCVGVGNPPTKMAPVKCLGQVLLTTTVTVVFRNPFPDPKKFMATLRGDVSNFYFLKTMGGYGVSTGATGGGTRGAADRHESLFSLTGASSQAISFSLEAFEKESIMVAYMPKAITEHSCVVVVEMTSPVVSLSSTESLSPSTFSSHNLQWEFPVEGVAEYYDSTPHIRLKSKSRQNSVMLFPLVLEHLSGSLASEVLVPEITINSRARYFKAAANSASVKVLCAHELNDKQRKEIIEEEKRLNETAVNNISEEAGGSKHNVASGGLSVSERMVYCEFTFSPLRPFVINGELLLKRKGGGMWRFPVNFDADPPDPDDTIELEAAVNAIACGSFMLYNVLPYERPFTAYFTKDSSKEFSVSPAKGVLPPRPRGGTADHHPEGIEILVKFASVQYGKTLVGSLIIDTEDMQWRYVVKGSLPKYEAPRNVESKVFKGMGIK